MKDSSQDIEEIRRKAETMFKREIEPLISKEDPRKFLAIDVESGDFEVSASELDATDRVRARNPAATIWLRRVGSPVAHRLLRSQATHA